MKIFKRNYKLDELISKKRVLIIYGPRRVGKTTLINDFLEGSGLKYKLDSGDNIRVQAIFSSNDFNALRDYSEGYELIVIDEAQQIKNIGQALKILVDNFPVFYIAAGSSSFDLSQKIGEPLTGRKKTLVLFPLSQMELHFRYNRHELKEQLEDFLVFGTYPEVLTASSRKEKIFILKELAESYLLKDILSLEKIKASTRLFELLSMLAFQVGNEVSYNKLASNLKIDVKTVARYLDLLEKGFVIKRIGGFSRNLRNEITSKAKYYFLDNGIRNAIISQFNPLKQRDDIGKLFENFIIIERLKLNVYKENQAELYFWRTHQREEIDLIENHSGKLFAFEIKWNSNQKKVPETWAKTYNSSFKIINKDNYLDFLL